MKIRVTKAVLLKTGAVAAAGIGEGCIKALGHFKANYDSVLHKPRVLRKLSGVALLMLTLDGRILYYNEDDNPVEILPPENYYAIGSGADFAIGALDAGCDGITAIRGSARRDPHTSGPYTVWDRGSKVLRDISP